MTKSTKKKTTKRLFVVVDGSNLYHKLKESQVDAHHLLRFDYSSFAKWLADKGKVVSQTYLLPAIQVAREKGKEVEYVGFSHAPSYALIKHATETRLLRKDDLTPFVGKVKKK